VTAQGSEVADSENLSGLFDEVRNWGRWGADDERGTLNHLTPEHRTIAAGLVVDGVIVSLAHDLPTAPTAETTTPAQHHMLVAGDARVDNGLEGYEASSDYVGTNVHSLGVTHIDALCHTFVGGVMYNGVSAARVRSDGATRNRVTAFSEGIVGRGVFFDIPAVRELSYLAGGDVVTLADFELAEAMTHVAVGPGDILIVGTGRDALREASGGELPTHLGIAGLHHECIKWLHERGVSVLGSDGVSDPVPHLGVPEWPFPLHQIGIVAMGLHLVDNMALAELAAECAARGRWTFQFVLTPLRLRGGTGSPVNPVAIF